MTAAVPALDQADAEFFGYLVAQCGYRDPKPLPDGMYAAIYPLIYTHAIIVGQIGDYDGYEDRWCFSSYAAANAAFDVWDGEGDPQGWQRMTGGRMTGGSARPVHSDNKTQAIKRLLQSRTPLSKVAVELELSIGQLRHHRRCPCR